MIPIKLDDTHRDVEILARWLYGYRRLVWDDIPSRCEDEIQDLINAHAFGRKRNIVPFMDKLLDELVDVMDSGYFYEDHSDGDLNLLISSFLKSFPPGSEGRQLLIHWLAYAEYVKPSAGIQTIGDNSFLNDLAAALMTSNGMDRGERRENFIDTCRIHEHTKRDEPCYTEED